MDQVAMAPYNFFASQRPAVILWENEIQNRRTQRFAKVFRIRHLWSRKALPKFENVRIKRPPFVEHSTSHVNNTWARRDALKSRQRANFTNLEA